MQYRYFCYDDHSMVTLRRPIAERDDPVFCPVCRKEMGRLIEIPTVVYNASGFTTKKGTPIKERTLRFLEKKMGKKVKRVTESNPGK